MSQDLETQNAVDTLMRAIRLALRAGREITYYGKPIWQARLSTRNTFVVVYYLVDGQKYREGGGGAYGAGIWPFTPAYEAILGQATSEN